MTFAKSSFEAFLTTDPAAANRLKKLLSQESILALRGTSKPLKRWLDDTMPVVFATGYYTYPVPPHVSASALYTNPTWVHAFERVIPHIQHLYIRVQPVLSRTMGVLVVTTLHTLLSVAPNVNKLTLRLDHPPAHPRDVSPTSTGAVLYVYPTTPPLNLQTPTHDPPLISIRQALESVNPPKLRVLRLPNASITTLMALRWGMLSTLPTPPPPSGQGPRPEEGGEESEGSDTSDTSEVSRRPFWSHITELDVHCVKWWDILLPAPPAGFDLTFGEPGVSARRKPKKEFQANKERYRNGIKILHDWLSSFRFTLKVLKFQWVELGQQMFGARPTARAFMEGYPVQETELVSDPRYVRASRGPNIFAFDLANADAEGVDEIWFSSPRIIWKVLSEVWVGGMGQVWAGKVRECAKEIRSVGVLIEGTGTAGFGSSCEEVAQSGGSLYNIVRFDEETETETESESEAEKRAKMAAIEGVRRGIMGGLGLEG